MKKLVALSLSLLVAACAITGCGSSGSADSSASGKTTAKVIDIELTNEDYAFGVDKDQPELLEEVNDPGRRNF
jgi:polar amino acid transport system substrate-binding protein